MTRDDAEEYTQSLGQIVAGSWRQVALAKRLGVPKALGLTVEQWVKDKLGGYAKLGAVDRKEAALELKADGHSTREIGEILGASHATVARDVSNETAGNDKRHESGRAPVSNETPLDAVAALAAAPGRGKPQFTGETEQHTPAAHIALVREVFEIDLDPASSAKAQETVRAKAYFDKEKNGLLQEWWGNVFLNPPYKQPDITEFVEKLMQEIKAGHVNQAIMLTHNYTDTEWFHTAAKHASAVCFTRGRVRFISPEGNEANPQQGQAFFYFGNDPLKFKAAFKTIGLVMTPDELGANATARLRMAS